jgi:hypothetical protein
MTRRARGVRNAEVDDDMAATRNDSSSGDDGLMGVFNWFRQCLLQGGSEEERKKRSEDAEKQKLFTHKGMN